MSDTARPNAMFPRWLLTLFYVAFLALLGYFIYGASKGQIIIGGRTSHAVMQGKFLWLACLFPLGLIGYVAARHDPAVKLDQSKRAPVAVASQLLGLASIAATWFINR